MNTEDEQLRRLKHDVAQLEHRIQEQDVEIQNLRAQLSRSQAALAEVQAENRAARFHALYPDDQFVLQSQEVGVYEYLDEDPKVMQIHNRPTNELRLLLRKCWPKEVPNDHYFEPKTLMVWVRRS
jgi:hypothetical protein